MFDGGTYHVVEIDQQGATLSQNGTPNHGVTIVAYFPPVDNYYPYFYARNSWGNDWNDKDGGYF